MSRCRRFRLPVRHGRFGTRKRLAGVGADVAHRQAEVLRRVEERGVGRQRQVRLGHADREVVEAVGGVLADLLLGLGIEVDVRGAVDALGDRLDLVLDRLVVGVERLELVESRNLFESKFRRLTGCAPSRK